MNADTYGLDYATRLNVEQEKQTEAAQPPALEPPFPWGVVPFDPFFFGLGEEVASSQ